MQQSALFVINGCYPFSQSEQPIKIQQIQPFSSACQLRQKKSQMIKKSEMITCPALIRINCIGEQGNNLVYFYEFVPHSIESYLRSKKQAQSGGIWQMTKKLLTKKINFELTLIINYLTKMKIDTELAFHHLGISREEKVKLYVSPKSKMGIKQELTLLLGYNHAKDKIMKQLQNLYEQLEKMTPSELQRAKSYNPQQNKRKDEDRNENVPVFQENSRLRQTRTFKESNDFRKRKMSSGGFEFGNPGGLPKFSEKSNNRKKKDHKYSFQQFDTEPDLLSAPKQPRSRDRHSFGDCDQPDGTSGIPQSKSIKIELQQTQNFDQKRQRKDSYKVKITTFREYELEGNPSNLFKGDGDNQADIFQYFAKKAQREKQQEQEAKRQRQSPEEQMFQQDKNQSEQVFGDKYRKETGETQFTNNLNNPEPPSPFTPHSVRQNKKSNINSQSSRNLEQRIRQAKERTSKALILIKTLRK